MDGLLKGEKMRSMTGSRTLAVQTLLGLVILVLMVPGLVFPADSGTLEKILGSPGQMQEGVVVFRFPRTDIKVAIDSEMMPTALGFASWTAFKQMGTDSMIMGDLVLLEKEINPVISALAVANIRITALHNHFIGDQPRIMYMHIDGMGKAEDLARGLRSALEKTGTPFGPSKPAGLSTPLTINTKRIEEIMGYAGQSDGGVLKITVGRSGVKMSGIDVTSSMGLNSWAGFIGSNERAHVAGDIAMTAMEVNPVIHTLRNGGINVVAVHNHMLDEEPRIFFLHYWGTGPAEKMAQTLREAFTIVKAPAK
jgi:hypothetical protein